MVIGFFFFFFAKWGFDGYVCRGLGGDLLPVVRFSERWGKIVLNVTIENFKVLHHLLR